MNETVAAHLSRDQVRQLLAAVGSEPAEDTTKIEASAYDWHQPHYFSREQLGNLENFTREFEAAMADKFTQLCRQNFDVTVAAATQHYAGKLLGQLSGGEQQDYYLAYGPAKGQACGFIGIPEQAAITWVTQLLGDAESEKEPTETLSHLEESLLLDVGAAILGALCASLHSSQLFEVTGTIVRGEPPVELPDLEELCKITFAVQKTGSEKRCEAYLVVSCSRLTPLMGGTARLGHKPSAEHISKAIVGHLQEMPITITARFARALLTFEEVMSLRPCDILLLNKPLDEPIELIVEGRTLFHGRPAKSAGQYAVTISELIMVESKT
jgi:flagellar motor switch protein FliM